MAYDSEEKPSISHDFSSTKTALFDTFNKLKKWREEQVQQFSNLQYLGSQKIIQLSGENQKQFTKLLENASKSSGAEERPQNIIPESSNTSLSLKNDFENYDTLHESSITGHLQQCFDDSSASSLTLSENKVKNVTNKPKRPFLKKGSGLLRYMPKSSSYGHQKSKKVLSVSNSPQKQVRLPQRTLHLKPAIRKTDIPSENVKHIRFDIPVTTTENNTPFISKIIEHEDDDKYSSLCSSSPDQRNELNDVTSSEWENLNQSKENKELEEFEMLENCAQNSSFNSDSSVVQRILHGDKTKPFPVMQKETMKPSLSSNVNTAFKETCGNSIFSAKFGLSKCLKEAHARKEILQKVISDINPRIVSLQREISRSKHEAFDDSDISERCSTPAEDRITPTLPENFSDLPISPPTVFPARFGNETSCNDDGPCDVFPDNDNLDEEDFVSEELDIRSENNQVNERSEIRNKLKELENEIEIYQELNAKLSLSCKERNEFLKKLQKEREEFNKYKEAEKKKLEAEIEEERRQIKRQKETFTRYQKLRKDNPTRKEREELNSLRQEVEKLQEEIKRQKIKCASDSRRWKNQIENAERERDMFKFENIQLEEQCQDLLAALKTRLKKRPDAKSSDKTDSGTGHENLGKEFSATKDAECQTEIKYISSDPSKISEHPNIAAKKVKTKVRFNLSPEYQENELETVSEEDCQPTETAVSADHNEGESIEKDTDANLSSISVSAESEFKEIDHGNKMERIYASGEREIIFHSGNRKIISSDGKVKFLFYNGDIKEIFPDKHEICRYVNGITETRFPDGLEVIEFPSDKIERRYPDGQKEVTFTDGTVHKMFADGSEEIRSTDGNVVKLGTDGTKTIEFANGQREIRTATYKRREFPDGGVKILYESGRQETRYPNGRIRIKDKEGKVLIDTKYLGLTKD